MSTARPSGLSVLSTVALVVSVVAVALPWLLVAGTTRNGLDSAQLLVSVADAGAPEGLRVMGLLWYGGALAALVGWGAGAVSRRPRHTRVAATLAALALLCWGGFVVWAGTDDRVLIRWPGPAVGLLGLGLFTVAHGHALRSR